MTSFTEAGRQLSSRYLSSLASVEYRKLWIATVCSQAAAWALIVARVALVLQLTGSAAWTGYVTFAAMIPSVLMSPIAGYLSDRFDRRAVLICAYCVDLGQVLLLAILVVAGWIEPWLVLCLAAVNGAARSTQMPAAQALLANTVSRENLLNAVSLHTATQQGSRFVGPFLILLVLWFTGHQNWVYFLCAGLYTLGISQVLRINTRSRGLVEAVSGPLAVVRNLGAGLHFMYQHPLVLSIILLVVAHCGMTMSFESLFPVLSREQLGLENSNVMGSTSYLMVGYGAAALVTAVALAGVRGEKARGQLFLWMAVLSGISPIALALSPNLPLAVLSTAGMGLSQGGFMTLSAAMLQTITPDEIRGRLMGVYMWHTQGFMAGFNLVNGTVTEFTAFTAPLMLAVGGVAFVVVVVLSLGRVPLRQLYARGMLAT